MRKAIKKILTGVALTGLNSAVAMADGGYIYDSHKPVDTGIESAIFYVVSLVFFVSGLLTLFVVKNLRTKVDSK